MRTFRYLQLDVFSNRPGAGNPLGVVVDAGALSAQQMQQIAAWLNLSETVFSCRSARRARITTSAFSPRARSCRLPGTPAWALPGLPGRTAWWDTARTTGCTSNAPPDVLPVDVFDRHDVVLVRLRAPRAQCSDTGTHHAAALAQVTRAFAMSAQAPALWNNGPSWWLLELADEAAVRTAVPDLAAIAALTAASGAVGLAIYAAAASDAEDLVVRAFCPGDGIPEDPVTGSANACIAARLLAEDRLPGRQGRYVASQGREVGRDGRVEVEVDAAGDVWIGGATQQVIEGRIAW